MKLRNKKTGEIGYLIVSEDSNYYTVTNDNWESCGEYYSLADLNEEWEDYEEPKEPALEEMIKKLENDFKMYPEEWNNLEEAKKAVEKLKAWKRLKDKGIFTYIDHLSFKAQEGSINFEFSKNLTPEDMKEADKDLDLLLGGEE